MRANPLDDVLQDVKYAARRLSKTPTFTLVAVLSLALGIGATTTVFSLVDSLLLRPLPVPHPERLVTLEQVSTDGVRQYNLSYDDAERFRELTGNTWSALAATTWADAYDGAVDAPGDWRRAETLRVSLVTGAYFEALGVRPRAGRALIGQDDTGAASPVAFIADRYWARRFGRSDDAIGRDIQLNGTRFIVVGIAPSDFSGDWVGWPTDVWVPSTSAAAILPGSDADIRTRLQYKVIARLAEGVSPTQAHASADAVYRELQRRPQPRSGVMTEARLELVSAARGYSPQRDSLSQSLTILAVTVGLALLVIGANVANLLLVRTAARDRELAVRISLGATRMRLVRQLMTENLLLTGVGAAAGLLLAAWGTDILAGLVRSAPVATIADGAPALELRVALDLRAVSFTTAIAMAAGLLLGFFPALRGSAVLLQPVLQRRNAVLAPRLSRRAEPRTLVLIGQIAASTVLLIGTGLFIRSIGALRAEPLGFDREQVLLIWALPGPTGRRGPALDALWDSIDDRLSALPGVDSVAVSVEGLLGASPGGGPPIAAVGSTQAPFQVERTMTVSAGFFGTIGQQLLDGREFERQDGLDAPPVTIVSESLARRAFGVTHVAGRRIRIGSAGGPVEIVGVVADARHAGPRRPPGPLLYFPPGQNLRRLSRSMCIVVRSPLAPGSLAPALRSELRAIDSALPVLRIDTVEEQLTSVLFQERLIIALAAFFAALAMLLTSLGLYAGLAFATEQRRREISIRIALGAAPSSVMRAVMRDGTVLVLTGLAIGIPAGIATLRLVSSRLFGVAAADPLTIVSVAVVLIAIAELAIFAPARRAAAVDPALALRME